MSGDTNFNQPPPVSYAQGLKEALEAQTALLTGGKVGEADFRDVGPLENLVRDYEAPLRKTTAQVDTDVLRQTLLGTGSGEVYAEDGRVITGYESATPKDGKYVIEQSGESLYDGWNGDEGHTGKVTITTKLIDTSTGDVAKESSAEIGFPVPWDADEKSPGSGNIYSIPSLDSLGLTDSDLLDAQGDIRESFTEDFSDYLSEDQMQTVAYTDRMDSLLLGNKGEVTTRNPIYKKDPATGEDFVAAPGTFTKGQSVRTGDGMVDLLGDTRGVQQAVRSEDYANYVRDNPDLSEQFAAARAEGDERTIEQFGKDHYEDFGKAEGREIKGTYALEDAGRSAGFDERGDFLGLSALSEDIQAGNLSRQRQRDLEDVARLSPLYSDIMDEYKPGTKQAITDARKVLEAQKGTLTGAGAIDAPASVAGSMGNITSGGIDASLAKRIDPLAAETGYTPSAAVAGGNIEADALRKALMKDAETSLAAGLTPREQEQIEQASRRRATALGRAFDRGSIADEVQSRVLEDRNRQAQNRAYAQQVLGQEAGLQESDLGRGLQASLANQQATNRAAEFGVGSGMQQEQAQAQIDFQTSLANQAALQDAAKFSAQEKMQAQLANEANRQQASSFDVSAKMDQQRLNEQLKQQGTLGYVDAATRLAALEDTSTLDPFQAVLGRAGGGSLQAGQGVFGQAGYGLQSAPQYLDPSAGLGYIQAQNANQASMYNAQLGANATRQAGMFGGLGSLGGGLMGAAFGKGGFLR
jgi:hypothetical protein